MCRDLATLATEYLTRADKMSLQVFGCPDCAQPFQVDSNQAGQKVRCPGCNAVVRIPDALGDSPQPPEPPPTQEVPEAFACPACESAFGVLASMYGTSIACPHCGQAVSIERTPPAKPEAGPTPSSPADPAHFLPKIDVGKTSTTKQPSGVEAAEDAVEQPIADSNLAPVEEESVAVFERQNVDHLLPPRFATLDPAFFYRRGNSTDQVLLPQAGGGVQAVSNRIVTVVHNGQEYQLISSPRYRRNLNIIVNSFLVLIAAALMVAIWWAVA